MEGQSVAISASQSSNFEPTLGADSRKQIQGTRWAAMDEEIDENLGEFCIPTSCSTILPSLGSMSSKLAGLRNLGMALGEEIEDQNQLLDRIQVKAERNDATVRNQDNQMKKLLGYKPEPAAPK